jgi:uncharacterized protein
MPTYTRPDVYAVEVQSAEGPVQAAATGFGGLQAVTEKGPIGTPVRTRSFPAWAKIFGGRSTRSDAAYEAKAFFDEGGVELITVRQGHFGDIDDKESFVGGIASRILSTQGVAATAASKQSSVGPFDMITNPDLSFQVSIDGNSPFTITVSATQATITSTASYPVSDVDGLTIEIRVDGGPVQTITFSGSTTTAQEVADQINQAILGASCYVAGAVPEIKSDKYGTDSSLEIVGGTAAAITWGSPVDGTGDVADASAVTAAEISALCVAEVGFTSQASCIVNSDGSFTIVSLTTGISSELDFLNACDPLGISVETINGTDSGATYQTLKLEAGYRGYRSPGTAGNELKAKATLNPLRSSAGAGNDILADITAGDSRFEVPSSSGISDTSVLTIADGTNTEYKRVLQVITSVISGVVHYYVDVTVPFTNGFTAAASTLRTNEFDLEIFEGTKSVETWRQLSMLDVADNYVETIINDENLGSVYVYATDMDAAPGIGADTPATDTSEVAFTGGTDETSGLVDTDWIGSQLGGTGLYAWDHIREFMPFCTPGNNSAALIHAASNYAASRLFFEYVTYVTEGLSGADAVSFRQNVVGVDSSYGAMYSGGMQVYDPEGSGSNPKRSIAGLGAIMGLWGRVDSLPGDAGGPWQAPAGEGDYGTLRTALDVATEYRDDEAGLMNDAGINVIRKFGKTNPVTVWGCRTLSTATNKAFLYLPVRRTFQFAEKSVVDSTRWAVHRPNNFRLWGRLKTRVETFFKTLLIAGAFPTAIKEEAFYVLVGVDDGVMDQSDIDSGRVIGRIGLAPNKPGEFIIWEFTQYDSGSDITE